jgi:septal ring-binding cell division protein DamX
VQLAIACEPPTVAQAVQTARDSSQLFILPAQIGGRSCYRMLWGAYASRPEADRARRSIPARFLKDPNPPFVRPL